MLRDILLIIFGAIIGFVSTLVVEALNLRKSRGQAKKLLLVELISIKKSIPGLVNSFNSHLSMMVNVNYTNSPIESNYFDDLRKDLLSLDQTQLETLISFYKSLQYCQTQFLNLSSIDAKEQKFAVGTLIKDSLEDIQKKLPNIESILLK